MKKSRTLAWILTAALTIGTALPVRIAAEEMSGADTPESTASSAASLYAYDEDLDSNTGIPGNVEASEVMSSAMADESEALTGAGISYANLIHDSRFDNMTRKQGIDVSKWQNGNSAINWSSVKASGIDFVLVRMGNTSLSNGGIYEDPWGVRNLQGAYAAGLQVGVYYYSQALTEAEGRAEAAWLIKAITPYRSLITMPVVMDYEYGSYVKNGKATAGRLLAARLSKAKATSCAKAFLSAVGSAGFKPMLYADKDFLTNQLNASVLDKDYLIWLARWAVSPGYSGLFSFWQFSSAQVVSGIPSGKVDRDVWYVPLGFVDIKASDFYKDAVIWGAENGITGGLGKVTFSPDTGCTRAQIVTMIYHAMNDPAVSPETAVPFTDVPSGAFYREAVRYALENGITSGITPELFAPDRVCSRAEAVTFLFRAYAKDKPVSEDHFTDIPEGAYYRTAANWAVEKGIVTGTGADRFSPYDACTRGQIITMLYNLSKS